MSLRLDLAALVMATLAADAAELPSRATKTTAHDTAPKCEIEGERGVALPGGGCVKISGYVNVGVAAGNLKH